jgi:hypothetical protein
MSICPREGGGGLGQLRQQRPRAVYELRCGLRIFSLSEKQLPENFVIWLQLTETSPQRVDRGLPGVHGGLGSLPPSRCRTVQEHRQPFQRVQLGDADAVFVNRHGVAADSPLAPANLLLQSARFPLGVGLDPVFRLANSLSNCSGLITRFPDVAFPGIVFCVPGLKPYPCGSLLIHKKSSWSRCKNPDLL